jgi:hypothetical protein
MARHNCYRCGESYDEDNLYECARCLDDVCWNCGILAKLPKLAKGNAWCDRCLKAVGRTDLLKGLRPKPRRYYGIRERFLASEGLKEIVTKGKPGILHWPETDEEREILTAWLEAIELDVDEDSPDFIVPPAMLGPKAHTLKFTLSGYFKLAIELTDKPIWLG